MADTTEARHRLAIAQAALLSALTAGGPVPDGFDRARLRVQREALAAKRADVLAKVAPELPRALGDGYRPAALAWARSHPLTGGYGQDAAALARHALDTGAVTDGPARRRLAQWLRERGAATTPTRRIGRLLSAAGFSRKGR